MTHLDNGVLLRFLDGENLCESAAGVREHLGNCDTCRTRLDEIRDTLTFVGDALSRTDIAVPRSGRRILPRFPLAAAAITILAIAAGFTPMSAWVIERTRLLFNSSSDFEVPLTEAVDDSSASVATAGSVSFFPASDVFVLEVASLQEIGNLSVEVGEFEIATATINGALEDENLLILPNGLRIDNSPTSTTSYVVLLPASVSQINVIVADGTAIVLDTSTLPREWTIPIGTR